MEHRPGGSYAGRIPCRCASCKSEHARLAREYRRAHKPPSIGKLKQDIRELEAFKAGVLAARFIGQDGQVTS